MQRRGGARGKEKKGGKRSEGAMGRKEKRDRGGEEREREGDTRQTSPSLLAAPLAAAVTTVSTHTCQ